MKIPRCQEIISMGKTTRQCLLDAGHDRPHPMDGLRGRRQLGSQDHEFAPICPSCGQIEEASPGGKRNVKVMIPERK